MLPRPLSCSQCRCAPARCGHCVCGGNFDDRTEVIEHDKTSNLNDASELIHDENGLETLIKYDGEGICVLNFTGGDVVVEGSFGDPAELNTVHSSSSSSSEECAGVGSAAPPSIMLPQTSLRNPGQAAASTYYMEQERSMVADDTGLSPEQPSETDGAPFKSTQSRHNFSRQGTLRSSNSHIGWNILLLDYRDRKLPGRPLWLEEILRRAGITCIFEEQYEGDKLEAILVLIDSGPMLHRDAIASTRQFQARKAVVYEAVEDSRAHLQAWRLACPYVFDYDPVALHFGFPRESEDRLLLLMADMLGDPTLCDMWREDTSLGGAHGPPVATVDVGDFGKLAEVEGGQWAGAALTLRHAFQSGKHDEAMDSAPSLMRLPSMRPSQMRPIFISISVPVQEILFVEIEAPQDGTLSSPEASPRSSADHIFGLPLAHSQMEDLRRCLRQLRASQESDKLILLNSITSVANHSPPSPGFPGIPTGNSGICSPRSLHSQSSLITYSTTVEASSVVHQGMRHVMSTHDLVEIFTHSRVIALDRWDDEDDVSGHLANGRCFVQAIVAIVTGSLWPIREGQFESLDNAIGAAIWTKAGGPSWNSNASDDAKSLRALLKMQAQNLGRITDVLCTAAASRPFSSKEERIEWVGLLRRTMDAYQKLPLMVTNLTPPAQDHNRMYANGRKAAAVETCRTYRSAVGADISIDTGRTNDARDVHVEFEKMRSERFYGKVASLRSQSQKSSTELGVYDPQLDDLLDNEVAMLMGGHDRSGNLVGIGDSGIFDNLTALRAGGYLADPANQVKLWNVWKLINSLFGTLASDEVFDPATKWKKHRATRWRRKIGREVKRIVRQVMDGTSASWFFLILTLYAVLVPDLAALNGYFTEETPELASMHTFVFCIFTAEIFILLYVQETYRWSARFYVDVVATISLIGDTLLVYIWLNAGEDPSGSYRIVSELRGGKLIRLTRLIRLTQVLRIFPRLTAVGTSFTNDLALLLVHKRLWRVFQYIMDDKTTKKLGEQEQDIFATALWYEFSKDSPHYNQIPGNPTPVSITISERTTNAVSEKEKDEHTPTRTSTTAMARQVQVQPGTKASIVASASRFSTPEPIVDGSFQIFVQRFLSRAEGKACLKHCQADVRKIRGSCLVINQASSNVALKVCIMVLLLFAILPIYDPDVTDYAEYQALMHMHHEADYLGSNATAPDLATNLCSAADRHDWQSKGKSFVYLAVQRVLVWSDATPNGNPCLLNEAVRDTTVNLLEVVQDIIESRPAQQRDFEYWCYPGKPFKCQAYPESIVLVDVQERNRDRTRSSLIYTAVAFCMVFVCVVAFSREVAFYNQYILHPLWSMLDDMTSLKCIEVVCMRHFQPSTATLRELRENQESSLDLLFKCIRQCHANSFKGKSALEDIRELRHMQSSFAKLCKAVRSWVKYVPPSLYKTLLLHGMEAKLGASFKNVCVVFYDIDGFSDMCRGQNQASEVLRLLEKVHGEVSTALEVHGGTLLEYIGDELLAVFNAPLEVTRYMERAVYAAVAAQEKAAACGVKLRIGVHQAQVLVGNIGSPNRLKYGVLGDGVNTSARLKSLNGRYGTGCLTSAHTLSFILHQIPDPSKESFLPALVVRPIGKLVLKGRHTATETWEVLGRKSELHEDLVAAYDLHWRAYQLFLQRAFTEAKALFEEVNAILYVQGINDRPSEMLIQSCAQYEVNPPSKDWDGSEVMQSK